MANPIREHATRLSTYLQDAVDCIDRTDSQLVPADLVKIIIHGTLRLILKVQHNSDLNAVCDALRILQNESKISSENTAQTLDVVKTKLKYTTETI